MTADGYAWVAAFCSVLSALGTWRAFAAWRSVLQRLEVQRDLSDLHEKRAEMYRAIVIEQQCRERRASIDTFGGAR